MRGALKLGPRGVREASARRPPGRCVSTDTVRWYGGRHFADAPFAYA